MKNGFIHVFIEKLIFTETPVNEDFVLSIFQCYYVTIRSLFLVHLLFANTFIRIFAIKSISDVLIRDLMYDLYVLNCICIILGDI